MENTIDYRIILKRELELKKSKNESYSLRAFAKYLGIAPSCLSEIFSRKRHLPLHKLEAVILKLGLTCEDPHHFATSLRQLRGEHVPHKVIIVPELKLYIDREQVADLQKMVTQFLDEVSQRFCHTAIREDKMQLRLDIGLLQD